MQLSRLSKEAISKAVPKEVDSAACWIDRTLGGRSVKTLLSEHYATSAESSWVQKNLHKEWVGLEKRLERLASSLNGSQAHTATVAAFPSALQRGPAESPRLLEHLRAIAGSVSAD